MVLNFEVGDVEASFEQGNIWLGAVAKELAMPDPRATIGRDLGCNDGGGLADDLKIEAGVAVPIRGGAGECGGGFLLGQCAGFAVDGGRGLLGFFERQSRLYAGAEVTGFREPCVAEKGLLFQDETEDSVAMRMIGNAGVGDLEVPAIKERARHD